jgi:hypothetical protein
MPLKFDNLTERIESKRKLKTLFHSLQNDLSYCGSRRKTVFYILIGFPVSSVISL